MISPYTQPDAFLKEIGLDAIEGGEREKVLGTLQKRFDDVVLSTVLEHLSPLQFEAFKVALKSENPDEEIAKVTGSVPGLGQIIDQRLEEEYELMKTAMN